MSECAPRPLCTLILTFVRSTQFTCLSFCELVYLLTIVDATTLHLSIERDTVKSHIGADWLREWLVVLVSLGNNAFTIPELMAHTVGHGTVLREVSYYGAILAPAAPLSSNLGPLLHREGL